MRKKILAAAILVACTACHASNSVGQAKSLVSTQVKPVYSIQNVEPTLQSYSVKPANLKANDVERIVGKYSLGKYKVEEGASTFDIHSDRFSLKVDKKTGAEFLRDNSKMWGADKKFNQVVPDEDESVKFAEKYLNDKGVAVDGDRLVYQINQMTRTNSANNDTEVVQREVIFKRKLGKHIIHGAGSQISVFVGPGGQINGSLVDWPTLVEDKKVSVTDGTDNLTALNEALEEENKHRPLKAKIKQFVPEVTDLEYGAYVTSDGSRKIVPVFAVRGTKKSDVKDEQDIVLLPATKDIPVPAVSEQSYIAPPAGNLPGPSHQGN